VGSQRFEFFKVLLTDGPNETSRTVKEIPLDSPELVECVRTLHDFRHSIKRSRVYFKIEPPGCLLDEIDVERLEFLY
jgi:hypothetical protein